MTKIHYSDSEIIELAKTNTKSELSYILDIPIKALDAVYYRNKIRDLSDIRKDKLNNWMNKMGIKNKE